MLLVRDQYYCTCVLINDRYALTAKHCLFGKNASDPFATDLLLVKFGLVSLA